MNKLLNKRLLLLILAIAGAITVFLGTSYAVFFKEDTANDASSYTTGLLDITSTGGDLTVNNSLPMSNNDGKNLTGITYTITNIGNLTYTFDVKLLATEESTLNTDYVMIQIDNDEPLSYSDLTSGIIKSNITLVPEASINITVRVWLSLDTPNSEIGKTFTGILTSDGIASGAPEPANTKIMALAEDHTQADLEKWFGNYDNENFNGVYPTSRYTDSNGDTKYHEYRYVGANPNNYVWFNNDMYQIIGVFDANSHGVGVTQDKPYGDYLIKLISVNLMTASSWGVMNTTNNSGVYNTTNTYKNNWTGKDSSGNDLSGFTKANANVLLNEFFLNKSNTSDTYGNCGDWTYMSANATYRNYDCNTLVGYGINNTYQNYIENVTWYLNGFNSTSYTRDAFYLCERGLSDNTNCKSGNNGTYAASTTDKIGLMYVSDYAYASGYYSGWKTGNMPSYLGNKNWLYKGYEWTITPRNDSATNAFYVNDSGYVNNGNNTLFGFGLRPTFYLKSSVYVTGGTGTFDDPYTIACDDCSE